MLFCVYFDELSRLRNSRIGCWIGTSYTGALAFADDLSLLAPTLGAMQAMLTIYDEFALEYNVIFNATKKKCLCFGDRFVSGCDKNFIPNFVIAGTRIECVDQWPHLGYVIDSSRMDDVDINTKLNKFRGQVNNVLCWFYKCDVLIRLKLFTAYCMNFFCQCVMGLAE